MLRRATCLTVLGIVAPIAVPAALLPAAAAPTWQMEEPISPSGESGDEPQVAMDGDGAITVVWQRNDDGDQGIVARHRSAAGIWGPQQPLSTFGPAAFNQQVAMDNAGNATAVWQVRFGSGRFRIQVSRRPAGGAWTAPVTLSEPGTAFNPQVAMSQDGDTTVVWERHDGDFWRVEASRRPPGGGWSDPRTLSPDGGNGNFAQVAMDAAGNTTAVWVRERNETLFRIQYALRPEGGPWSGAARLSPPGDTAFGPYVAMSTDGNTTAGWTNEIGADRVQVARRTPGGPWSAPDTISPAGQNSTLTDLAATNFGATAVWSGADGVEASRTSGGPWSSTVVLSDPDDASQLPEVAMGGRSATVVWDVVNDSADLTVNGTRRPPGGPWEMPQTLSPAGALSYDGGVAMSRNGEAVAVWMLFDGTNDRVQVSRYAE